MPFRIGKISQTTNPVKVFEYFALGKPVVSTRLKELEPYAARQLLSIADTAEQFAEAVESALRGSAPDCAEQRRQVARDHSWRAHAERMIEAFYATQGQLPAGGPGL
ncbi:hypothetical protein EHM92_06990 [bacterium]|nr:MAG: hypothetical protein EHM92_06990 [bacterium]